MGKKSFVAGAAILMAAGFAVRLLGFVYRVFLSNTIGAEGMGLFQLISPVYSLIILTLTSGISIAVSKMTAAELALSRKGNLHRISNNAVLLVFSAGILASLLLYVNLQSITDVIMKDSRTYYSLFLLVPSIPFIAISSAIRGYFYGTSKVTPPALAQIAEQIAKMVVVMLLAGLVVPLGLEYACALATAGMIVGELAGLLIMLPGYFWNNRERGKGHASQTGGWRDSRGWRKISSWRNKTGRKRAGTAGSSGNTVILEILRTAVPVSANRFIVSILSTVEYILIPAMLAASGLNYQESLEIYGKLSGMAMPLIFFPSLVTFSLATTLVPAISEASSLKNRRSLNYRTGKSIQLTLLLGIVCTFIFIAFPDDISKLVYRNQGVGDLLFQLSFCCMFVYLQQVLTGVLNGLGKQALLLRNTIIGSVVRIGAVCLLIPVYGIESYIWGLTASFILTDLLNLSAIHKMTGLVIDLRNWLIKPAIASLAMIIASKGSFVALPGVIASDALRFAVSMVVGAIPGFLVLLALGVVNIDSLLKRVGKPRKNVKYHKRQR